MGEVYDGIGLRLKAYGNNVEKLFTVTPDANPEAIKVGISGATALKVNEDGQLEAETELGPVKFTKPVAYQEIDGKRVVVACGYTIAERVNNLEFGFWNLDCFPYSAFRNLKSANSDSQNPQSAIQNPKLEYGFTVASYDKTKDLIIDPLLASTYLGGSYYEYVGYSLALDTSGNVYVTGYTYSLDFPTTSGAYDTSLNGYGSADVFVSKLDGGLTSLLASTYLGGSSYDYGYSLALDPSGNVYVTGRLLRQTFRRRAGRMRPLLMVVMMIFVSKLNGGLTSLLASTYLGGSSNEWSASLTLDPKRERICDGVYLFVRLPDDERGV